jgi:hypothetical protein
VLLGLLSGVRASRSPLIVGYVALVGLWLLLFDELPESQTKLKRRYHEVGRILEVVGPIGRVAAASFFAYLIGDLVVRESSRVLQIRSAPVEAAKGATRSWLRAFTSITHDAEMDELEKRLRELVYRSMGDGLSEAERHACEGDLLEKISTAPGQDLRGLFPRRRRPDDRPPLTLEEQVRVEAKSGRIDERILATNPELFNELFRLRSEAEFRAGLLPALLLLVVALLIRSGWGGLLIAGVAAGFVSFEILTFREVFQLRTRARGIAMRAVVDGLVSTPTLDAIEREVRTRDANPAGALAPPGRLHFAHWRRNRRD